ncbi:MAG: HTTM domain-containing protein [Phototrophicaceae bacterium]
MLAQTRRLFAPVDIMPLVFFRLAFGIIMLWEVWRYFRYDRIFRYYVEPTFYFKYYGFEWVHPLPGDGMFWLFYGLGALSILILVGLFYRVSMALFWLGVTYVFLLDQTQYLNHFYLICLISFLLIFVPAHRALSLDSLLRPAIRSETAPVWSLWLLRGQMAVVYFFGGLAKINADWLRGEPMRSWLAARADFPVIGQWFTEEWMVYIFSYGGMLFDLLIVPLLLWPRTRLLALLLAFAFHLSNFRLFNIGIFPWFSLAITFLYLPPHWFRLGFRAPSMAQQLPVVTRRNWVLVGAVGVFFAIQIALPLRHWFYPSNVNWTEEGHNLAWRMKLRDKSSRAQFFASDPKTGSTWAIDAREYLNNRQIGKMSSRPAMILRFAHFLTDELRAEGYEQIQIRAWVMSSLNSRPRQLLIDPTTNLSGVPFNIRHSNWILPLKQPSSPAPTQPTLLMSRRVEGAVTLINAAQAPFPLADLRLAVDNGIWLSGTHFGATELAPGECLVIRTQAVEMPPILPNCAEVGARQMLDPVWRTEPVLVTMGATSTTATCDDVTCVISAPPDPPQLPQPSAASGCVAELPDGWMTYHIGPDDTLASLAETTGTTSDRLAEANCLDSDGSLTPGLLFFVPHSPGW